MYKGDLNKGEIEFLSEDIVFKNKFVEISNDNVLFPGNINGKFLRIKAGNGGVIIIPRLQDGRFCLQKNFRHAARKWILEFPKGYIDNDLTPEESVLKELQEEMGLFSNQLVFLGTTYESPSTNEGKTFIFFANNCVSEGVSEQEETECLGDIEYYSFEELFNLVKNNVLEFSMDETAFFRLTISNYL